MEHLIVAVNYFGSNEARGLVDSLMGSTDPNWTLIIADNSIDEREHRKLTEIAARDHRVFVHDCYGNLGYFGGARAVLATLELSAYGWVHVVNTDITYDSRALEKISNEDARGVGVVAPSIIARASGSDQNPFQAHRPSDRAVRRRRVMLANVVFAQGAILLVSIIARIRKNPRQQGVAGDIYAPHGSAIVFSNSYFRMGGNLDHPLFLFGEELHVAEQCMRLGLAVRYVPDVRVRHIAHAQIGTLRSRRVLGAMVESARYEWAKRFEA